MRQRNSPSLMYRFISFKALKPSKLTDKPSIYRMTWCDTSIVGSGCAINDHTWSRRINSRVVSIMLMMLSPARYRTKQLGKRHPASALAACAFLYIDPRHPKYLWVNTRSPTRIMPPKQTTNRRA